MEVRPECAGIIRNLPVTEPPLTPPDQSQSPYFMDNDDPEKYLKQGDLKSAYQTYTSLRTTILFTNFLKLQHIKLKI